MVVPDFSTDMTFDASVRLTVPWNTNAALRIFSARLPDWSSAAGRQEGHRHYGHPPEFHDRSPQVVLCGVGRGPAAAGPVDAQGLEFVF